LFGNTEARGHTVTVVSDGFLWKESRTEASRYRLRTHRHQMTARGSLVSALLAMGRSTKRVKGKVKPAPGRPSGSARREGPPSRGRAERIKLASMRTVSAQNFRISERDQRAVVDAPMGTMGVAVALERLDRPLCPTAIQPYATPTDSEQDTCVLSHFAAAG